MTVYKMKGKNARFVYFQIGEDWFRHDQQDLVFANGGILFVGVLEEVHISAKRRAVIEEFRVSKVLGIA